MNTQALELSKITELFPTYFQKKQINIPVFDCKTAQLFSIHGPHFAKLATKDFIKKNAHKLIKVSIKDELSILTDDHQLEISIPTLGLTDLLENNVLHTKGLSFATPVAINGLVASSNSNKSSYPDFILATDILGNQYEVMVDLEGTMTLPREGTGLFSILSHLTFIYSEWQLNKEVSLENAEAEGIEPGFLYLLPPSIEKEFSTKISVTHIDKNNRRIVDSIRSVDITTHSSNDTINLEVLLERDKNNTHKVDMFLSMKQGTLPYALKFTLSDASNTKFSFEDSQKTGKKINKKNWSVSAEKNTFIKHFNVSDETKFSIIRDVYSEAAFMRDYLLGDRFGISHHHNYNNFTLFPEALGKIYDLVIDDIVHHQIKPQFIWERISDESLFNINLQHLNMSKEDSALLSDTLFDKNQDSTSLIKSWFDSQTEDSFEEKISFYSNEAVMLLPSIKVKKLKTQSSYETYLNRFNKDKLSTVNSILTQEVPLTNIKSHDSSLFYSVLDNTVTDLKLHFNGVDEATITHDLPLQTQELLNLSNTAGSFYGYQAMKNTQLAYVNQSDERHLGFGFIQNSNE